MKTTVKPFVAALLLASVGSALAAVHYVDVNSTNAAPPYTSWATAATNIQDAVDAAVAGGEIVVTNGIYAVGGRTVDGVTTNRVAVYKPLALRSVNGPQSTIIDGGQLNRCAYLTNGASLSSFTLTNGPAPVGGGLWCESANAVVSNCVVSGNSSFDPHPDLLVTGSRCCNLYLTFAGGVYGGTLNDCTLSDNAAETHSFLGHTCDRTTCHTVGDGQFQIYYSLGAGGGAANAILNNCTLTANRASFGGGAHGCTLNNCIVYFNEGGNYDSSSMLSYSCTSPQPTNGVGNITNAPLFVDQSTGNLRLQSNSPCINAGLNSLAPAGPDLNGQPRISGGIVDIGAYEFQFNQAPVAFANVSPLFAVSPDETNRFILSPNNADVIVVLDGSQSSDADNDSLQFSWYAEGQTAALATGAVSTNLFAVGPHTVQLVVGDGHDDATAHVSFEVITPATAVGQLVVLVDEANLGSRNKQPLLATLSAAISSFDRGDVKAALNQLSAFHNKVRAQVASWNPALASEFTVASQTIYDVVSRHASK